MKQKYLVSQLLGIWDLFLLASKLGEEKKEKKRSTESLALTFDLMLRLL
jgi:hypothetical protein